MSHFKVCQQINVEAKMTYSIPHAMYKQEQGRDYGTEDYKPGGTINVTVMFSK